MARQRGTIVGRRVEIEALTPRDDRGGFVALRGPRGSGRTTVLRRVAGDLRGAAVVLDLRFGGPRPGWDRFGATAVLDAVRERFDELDAGPELGASITAVDRLRDRDTYATPSGRSTLLGELRRLWGRIGGRSRVVVLADDADAVRDPLLALAPAYRAGHLVIAACGEGTRSDVLCGTADRVVELGPLADDDVEALLRRTAGAPVDPAVPRALRAALGPLFGNPATLLATVAELHGRGRLQVLHDHLCLVGDAPLPLPVSHPLPAGLTDVDRDLVVLVSGGAHVAVDDVATLAAATGRDVDAVGHALDRLVDGGTLAVGPAGRLTVTVPALAGTLHEQHDCGAHLHAAVARAVLDGGCPAHPGVLADHVAAAGPAFGPRPDLATALHDEAVRVAVTDPVRAADRHLAAWRHAGPGRGRYRVGEQLVRLLVRTGQQERLGAFVAEVVAADPGQLGPRVRRELAAAAALSALHTGVPVDPGVAEVLADPEDPHCPLRLARRWGAGEPVVLDEIVAAFAFLTVDWPAPRHRPSSGRAPRRCGLFGVEIAALTRHLVPIFEWLFGTDYTAPRHGPAAAYDRVMLAFADARWADALAAERELLSGPVPDPLAVSMTTLLAAEMCTWRGEDRAAAARLDRIAPDDPYVAIRGWVEAGVRLRAGDLPGALEVGWSAVTRAAELGGLADTGGWRLLVRLATVATVGGDTTWQRRIAEACAERVHRAGNAATRESVALVAGLTGDDEPALREGLSLVRAREHRADLVWACLAAGLVAADPRPRMHEAYAIAREMGASGLRATARQLMARCGVTAPVSRTRTDGFSETELRIVELIRTGATNRQIALALQVSEKTVENHLTKLFLKAGCRTRHGLAAASLDGRLEAIGA